MKKILALLTIFLFILSIGCSKKEETNEDIITGDIIKEIEVEESKEEIIEESKKNITTVRICYDSDNGIIRWVNGTVMGFYDNTTRFEFKDYCYTKNYLVEYYCENETPVKTLFLCKNGCIDSHCS